VGARGYTGQKMIARYQDGFRVAVGGCCTQGTSSVGWRGEPPGRWRFNKDHVRQAGESQTGIPPVPVPVTQQGQS